MTTQDAEKMYRQILAQSPGDADARINLGILLHESGRFSEAVLVYRTGLAIDGQSAQMWSNLGNSLSETGELDQAAAACRQAIALAPRMFAAHTNLANALGRKGDLAGAAAHYRQAIAINPDFADAYNNLGTVLHGQGDLPGAQACIRRAIALRPDYAQAHSNLGSVLGDLRLWHEAVAELETAVKLRPDLPEAHWNLGLLLLLLGDMERGWREYEWRWKVKGLIVPQLQFARPQWKGEELNGRRILLHAEQGLGDAIQFVRFAGMVRDRGGVVIIYCPPELVRLFGGVEGVAEVVGWDQTLPEFDLHCPLLSLAGIFGVSEGMLAEEGKPYIKADGAISARWKNRVKSVKGVKVGLAWAGRATHTRDRERSIPLAAFAPLAAVEGVKFFSLQKGQSAAGAPVAMTDWTAELSDMAETAGLIENLDLVITADTAVAHLAGAMGKRVWVLLPFTPDFRWMLNRADSPWYGALRLFRQKRAGDWGAVMEEVAGVMGDFW